MSQDEKIEEGRTGELVKKNSILTRLNKVERVRLVSILYVTGVLLDYLFVYCVMIDLNKYCIELEEYLGAIAFASRFLLEILNVIIFCTMFNLKRFKSRLRQKAKMKFFFKMLLGKAITKKEFVDFLIFHQILSIILVSIGFQVMLLISYTSKREELIAGALSYLLWPHLQRLFIVIKIILKRRRATLSRFSTRLARLFFFVYIYSVQFFAALWYLPAIYKESRCWKEAIKNRTRVDFPVLSCGTKSLNLNESILISEYCYSNTTSYKFGIYGSVHESGVLRKKISVLNILYFSRWALQCLSSFAQGLEAGDNVWQNIFVIFIILYGVFMFFFLIAEVQSERQKLVKLKPKLEETGNWMIKKKLPKDLRSQIKIYKQDKWPEAKDVDIVNVFNNLPENLRGKLTHQLCLKLLKKVDEFRNWSEESLEDLCNYVKPVFYTKGTRIIREGDPIDEMVFVVQGVLWAYPSESRATGSQTTSHCSQKNHHLKEGDFYGEKLVNCIRADPYSFKSPISTETIQAGSNVEAFVIMVYDLKKVFIKYQGVLLIQLYWRFRRALRLRRNAQNTAKEAHTTNTD